MCVKVKGHSEPVTHVRTSWARRNGGQVDPERKGNFQEIQGQECHGNEATQGVENACTKWRSNQRWINPKRGGEANQARRGIPNSLTRPERISSSGGREAGKRVKLQA
jgi:hypothetical protein